MFGVQSDLKVFVSGPPKEKPSNWDASVRAYDALAFSCGRNSVHRYRRTLWAGRMLAYRRSCHLWTPTRRCGTPAPRPVWSSLTPASIPHNLASLVSPRRSHRGRAAIGGPARRGHANLPMAARHDPRLLVTLEVYLDPIAVEVYVAVQRVVGELQLGVEEPALVTPFVHHAEARICEVLPVIVVGIFAGGDAEDHRGLVPGLAHGLDLIPVRYWDREVVGKLLSAVHVVVRVEAVRVV